MATLEYIPHEDDFGTKVDVTAALSTKADLTDSGGTPDTSGTVPMDQLGTGGDGDGKKILRDDREFSDALLGPLTLPGNPTANLHAATKQYVDGRVIDGYDPAIYVGGNCVYNADLGFGQVAVRPQWFTETAGLTITKEDSLSEVVGLGGDESFVIKCVSSGSGANIYSYQQLGITDHWPLELARDKPLACSAGLWVYQKTTADTLKLRITGDVSGTIGNDSTTATDTWTLLKVENFTIGAGDTSINLEFATGSDSDTFYVAKPMVNVGPQLRPYEAPPVVTAHVAKSGAYDSSNPPSGSWQNLDLSSYASAGTFELGLTWQIDSSSGGVTGFLCPKYRQSTGYQTQVARTVTTNQTNGGCSILCDEDQIISWRVSSTDCNRWRVSLRWYRRWAY
jgi:hypothetical protein